MRRILGLLMGAGLMASAVGCCTMGKCDCEQPAPPCAHLTAVAPSAIHVEAVPEPHKLIDK